MQYLIGGFILILIGVFALNSVNKHERIKALEANIDSILNLDWQNGIPFKKVIEGHNICLANPKLSGCDDIDGQIMDIATSFQSCAYDTRSRLCQGVYDAVIKDPINQILPKADALQLPDSPFYFNMPTKKLDALSGQFGYRAMVERWWWNEWRAPIFKSIALCVLIFIFLIIVREIYMHRLSNIKTKIEADKLLADSQRADAEEIRAEDIRRKRAENLANLARETLLAERRSSELKAAQVAARLKLELAEQAKAALILDTIFKGNSKQKPK